MSWEPRLYYCTPRVLVRIVLVSLLLLDPAGLTGVSPTGMLEEERIVSTSLAAFLATAKSSPQNKCSTVCIMHKICNFETRNLKDRPCITMIIIYACQALINHAVNTVTPSHTSLFRNLSLVHASACDCIATYADFQPWPVSFRHFTTIV